MNREEIYSAISTIMIKDGPDGHTDGSDEITEFVLALLNGKGQEWINEYRL